MIRKAIGSAILWLVRRIRKRQQEDVLQAEQIARMKKQQNDDIAADEWKEKLDRAWKECSSYGKSHTQSRTHYRRRSAH